MIHYRIEKQQLRMFTDTADRLGAKGLEACGHIVLSGNHLLLVPVTNRTHEMGSFLITQRHSQIALAARGLNAGRIVGSYHSHPASLAVPGESDIAGSFETGLMLIWSCFYRELKLWRAIISQNLETRRGQA